MRWITLIKNFSIKPTLHSWDKPYLIMMHYLFVYFWIWHASILIRIMHLYLRWKFGKVFFVCNILVCFWLIFSLCYLNEEYCILTETNSSSCSPTQNASGRKNVTSFLPPPQSSHLLGYDSFSDFPYCWWPWWCWGLLVRYFVKKKIPQ